MSVNFCPFFPFSAHTCLLGLLPAQVREPPVLVGGAVQLVLAVADQDHALRHARGQLGDLLGAGGGGLRRGGVLQRLHQELRATAATPRTIKDIYLIH